MQTPYWVGKLDNSAASPSGSSQRCGDRPTRRTRNTKALHLVKQRGALHPESGGCSFRTAELPVRALTGRNNFSTYLFLKCRVDDLCLRRFAGLKRPWFKNAII